TEFLYTVIGRVQWNIGRPDAIILLFYIVFLVLLWYRLKDISIMPSLKSQTAAISVFVVFIILLSIPAAPKQDELLYLDTGQGSCALLRTSAGEVVLFDTGAQKQELSSVLAWYGVNHVEAIILSHGDMDHISGLTRVMETVSIEHIFMESAQMQRTSVQECLNKAKQKGIDCHAVEGQKTVAFSQCSVSLAVFHDNSHTTNNTELAAILYYPKGAIAFPGDLALSAVQQFISQEDTITIWTVPHHGSRNSGSANLYEQLKQKGVQYAVISAGRENRYGHPHTEVLEWIDQSQILRYSTAEQGAILFLLSEL
ncbi:MAG: MBL fold metallo-hydrolase, partial [Peptococcaceae bacterium]|nr:MBL fold metallo-hydrolase [Peptococcaceae bacterium]